MMHRRTLITGLVSLVAAPAIVRVESLMRLPKPILVPVEVNFGLTIQPVSFGLKVGDVIYQGSQVFGTITAIGSGGEFMFRRYGAGDLVKAAVSNSLNI